MIPNSLSAEPSGGKHEPRKNLTFVQYLQLEKGLNRAFSGGDFLILLDVDRIFSAEEAAGILHAEEGAAVAAQ